MVILHALLQRHIACSVLHWLVSPENSNISLKKRKSLWGASITSPWCGIKRNVSEHEMMLGNTVQKKLRGRRVGNMFEGKISFSCAASPHDLHLWRHSRPADFQEVIAHNAIVDMEYVSSLKLTVGWKETLSITREQLTCWYTTQLFLIFLSKPWWKSSTAHSIKMSSIYILAQASQTNTPMYKHKNIYVF